MIWLLQQPRLKSHNTKHYVTEIHIIKKKDLIKVITWDILQVNTTSTENGTYEFLKQE